MSQTLHADEGGYAIRQDDEIDAIVHEWKQFVTGEDFREACWELLEIVRETGARKLLIDQRGMNAMDGDDMAWMVGEWTPEIDDTRLEYTMIVINESAIAEMNVERVMENVGEVEGDQDIVTDIDEGRAHVRDY